jgi:hypothetical protein
MSMEAKYHTTKEVAAYFKKSPSSIYAFVDKWEVDHGKGNLPDGVCRPGGYTLRFVMAEFEPCYLKATT